MRASCSEASHETESSVEPSSMTINSQSATVCARTEPTASRRKSRRTYVGSMIETAGRMVRRGWKTSCKMLARP
ncbi:MAG: hypothetical protein JWL61_294 [Gemmatimonadetes bacterium]|nr:hypothetical protein [Gemmatimonadota bacterium]